MIWIFAITFVYASFWAFRYNLFLCITYTIAAVICCVFGEITSIAKTIIKQKEVKEDENKSVTINNNISKQDQ